jgi:hypothetical protein
LSVLISRTLQQGREFFLRPFRVRSDRPNLRDLRLVQLTSIVDMPRRKWLSFIDALLSRLEQMQRGPPQQPRSENQDDENANDSPMTFRELHEPFPHDSRRSAQFFSDTLTV